LPDGCPYEIKAIIALTAGHATYQLDEYELRTKLQSGGTSR
jgi:hypothetical protein